MGDVIFCEYISVLKFPENILGESFKKGPLNEAFWLKMLCKTIFLMFLGKFILKKMLLIFLRTHCFGKNL